MHLLSVYLAVHELSQTPWDSLLHFYIRPKNGGWGWLPVVFGIVWLVSHLEWVWKWSLGSPMVDTPLLTEGITHSGGQVGW